MPKPQLVHVTLRPATQDDCRRLWNWRNESATREASFDTHFIPYKDHENWFSRKMQAQDTRIFIILDAYGREVGYVRFNISGEEGEVSVSVDKAERGKGYGAAAIKEGSDQLLATGAAKRIVAQVKHDNAASVAAFQRAGFEIEAVNVLAGTEIYQMVYVDIE